jgi:tetratricopeptide (TPR) repeat protein
MKNIIGLSLIMSVAFASAQLPATPIGVGPSRSEKAVTDARRATTAKPDSFAGYNQLALALVQRGQETADPACYGQAKEAVKKSLALAPDNFETRKVEVAILLAEHEYPSALKAATVLNKKMPDDVMVYGFLTDADIARSGC